MLNHCTAKTPPKWVEYSTLKPGDWFWTHNPDPNAEICFPMFKVEGGYVSPANGAFCTDAGNCYDKVIPCPAGTEITISVSTREQ